MLVSIGEASSLIGVSVSTLRRWEKEGNFFPISRTIGGHRRYSLEEIQKTFFDIENTDNQRENICYARVSSHDQKKDLATQVKRLTSYCEQENIDYDVIKDLGSGLNYNKRGLKKLVEKICARQVDKVILTNKDRLLRFGSELLFSLCQLFGTEVIILNETKKKSFEEELVGDVIEIMTVFTSKIYGKRSHLNKKAA